MCVCSRACVRVRPQETEFELLGRVELHSSLGPGVEAAWFIYLHAWLPKALEFLIPMGVLVELRFLGPSS